ncbi:class I SAM-dependent methyltransferase [Oceanomicrobium pacificus]|uniref:Methyltransferase domain-containing protein n=1 Tax=Oceanomicrobium pacificus TaxID=2692916 RepID=A0A6B0TT54_9RHOB|nr:class I SAM-dependent methyltransferase [Oceanomicrobium pacificus]MXU65949.1 methyltransferase domain-containing protein [Oceanomicrobium pacificus]
MTRLNCPRMMRFTGRDFCRTLTRLVDDRYVIGAPSKRGRLGAGSRTEHRKPREKEALENRRNDRRKMDVRMNTTIVDNQSIESFYDDFLKSKMIGYRVDGNKRISLAIDFALRNIDANASVLDVGCGIGIATEQIAKKANPSKVLGVDIAPENIGYARKTARHPNLDFLCINAAENLDAVRDHFAEGIDVICMFDVIEHIKPQDRRDLFASLSRVSNPGARLIVTYPSPEYQLHIMENNPDELQIVDEVIYESDLISEAGDAGWRLTRFEYKSVWSSNQYIHAVLAKSRDFGDQKPSRSLTLKGAAERVGRKILKPWLRYKYQIRPFRK